MPPNLSWTLSPPLLLALLAAGAAYIARWRRVRAGTGPRRAADAPVWRLCCFIAALLALACALVSPLDSLAEQLFALHMVQHVLLLDVAPILAILSFTRVLLRPVTRSVGAIERRAGALAAPA
ncbi:MAG TPA: cytochrome c oxidase assembly protein, partial [Solirubrobacteraceae bacterium]|nr:cytochrome c oxidase assembly protein [Solirubrobacteraceae bacterium]